MFATAQLFDSDVSLWDTSNVVSMSNMFYYATSFVGVGIENWNVSQVVDMSSMFRFAKSLNSTMNLSNWDISNVKYTDEMFFYASTFRGYGIENWNTSNIRSMREIFSQTNAFNGDVSKWDLSNVQTLDSIFWKASSFNGDLTKWNTKSVTNFQGVFLDAISFIGTGVENFNTSQGLNMYKMFYHATLFNANLSKWDVSRVLNLKELFEGCTAFTGIGLNNWNIQNANDISYMFYNTPLFNNNLSKWDTSKVTNMKHTFTNSYSFTGIGIDTWNTANVVDTRYVIMHIAFFIFVY